VSWSERPLHPAPAQQDGCALLLGQTWGFAQCCKKQATLAVKMENQNKMPSSEHVCGDNKERIQRESDRRALSFAFF